MCPDPPNAESDESEDSADDVARTAREFASGTFHVGVEPITVLLDQPWDVITAERVVNSLSTPGVTYLINLATLTCSCSDFLKRRASFDSRDARRVCKHLRREMERDHLVDRFSDLARIVITSGYAKETLYRALVDSNHSVVLGVTAQDPWVDVYARVRDRSDRAGALSGAYHCYGWNVENGDWSYGDRPVGASEIKRLLTISGLAGVAAPHRQAAVVERRIVHIRARPALDPELYRNRSSHRAARSADDTILRAIAVIVLIGVACVIVFSRR